MQTTPTSLPNHLPIGATTIGDDVLNLVAALGGDSVVSALYDHRSLAAGLVSSWRDYRGDGLAPVLAAAGSARPTKDGTGVVFNGTTHELISALDPAFDLSGPKSLIVVAKMAVAGTVMNITQDAEGVGPYMAMQADGIDKMSGDVWDGATEFLPNSGVAFDPSVVSLVFVSSTTSVAKCEHPNHAAGTTTGLTLPSANGMLQAGCFSAGVSNSPITAKAIIFLNRAYTAADKAAIAAWAIANHGAVLAS